jgi:aquaglyceroporin related protein
MESFIANQPYVDPGYAQLNPAYDQPTNIRPVWGLAKPLPHVLRPGMVPAKDELKEELQQHREDHHETNASVDLESGRVEPTLWPDRIASQLDTIRRGREVQLFESYQRQQKASPILSPLGRMRTASDTLTEVPDMQTTIGETIVEENEDDRSPHREHGWASDPDVAHLGEAIANVNRTKEMEDLVIPYQDAIPLLAYEAEDDEIHNLHTYWSVIRLRLREPLAELLAVRPSIIS